jgi:hypothetical protein
MPTGVQRMRGPRLAECRVYLMARGVPYPAFLAGGRSADTLSWARRTTQLDVGARRARTSSNPYMYMGRITQDGYLVLKKFTVTPWTDCGFKPYLCNIHI